MHRLMAWDQSYLRDLAESARTGVHVRLELPQQQQGFESGQSRECPLGWVSRYLAGYRDSLE